MTVSSAIKSLVKYGVKEGLLDSLDEIWAINRVLEILELDAIESDAEICEEATLEEILKVLLDYACENGICEDSVVYRDLFDTKIMGAICPRPSEVIKKFNEIYKEYEKCSIGCYSSNDIEPIKKEEVRKLIKNLL